MKTSFICVVLGVFALTYMTGCEHSKGEVQATAPVPNVQTLHPHRGEIARSVTLPGNIRAYQQATLYAKVAGYLRTIRVDRGDRVKQGDLVAEVEVPELLADRLKFKADAEVAEITYKRLDEAQKKSPDLVVPKTVDEARGNYNVALANMKRVETLLDYAKIVAPFSGIITKRWVDPGAFIPAATSSSAAQNAAVVTLMDFSAVRIDAWMPESEVPLVKNGLPVNVTVSELPGRVFEGRVTRIAYVLDDATKNMAAEIEIPNPDLELRPGMYASVKIDLQRKSDALLVPSEAIITEKNQSSVFTVVDGKVRKAAVKTGFDDGISVELLDGVTSNDLVILAGKQSISDGQQVHAMEVR